MDTYTADLNPLFVQTRVIPRSSALTTHGHIDMYRQPQRPHAPVPSQLAIHRFAFPHSPAHARAVKLSPYASLQTASSEGWPPRCPASTYHCS